MLQQEDSPLFRLPAELRSHIWWYVYATIDLPLRPLRLLPPRARDFDGLLYSCKRAYKESRSERVDAIGWLLEIDTLKTVGVLPPLNLLREIRTLKIFYEDRPDDWTAWATDELVRQLRRCDDLAKITITMTDLAYGIPGFVGVLGEDMLPKFRELAHERGLQYEYEHEDSYRTW